jgi:ABC-2 type transport system ATP-binding protein
MAIEAESLARSFGNVRALDGVSLRVSAGEVYGLLGPNGAGKTTLVRLLATLDTPDHGHARVFGHDTVDDAEAVRQRVALTGQHASVDADLTGAENLVLLARLLGLRHRNARRRAGELLEAFDLADAGRRQVHTYSGGMRRRLDLAASLVIPPELLFLDEPTTGLDPRSRSELWRLVRSLVAGGTTVLLTTQYLEEADQLADRIGVIDNGRLIEEGTPSELKSRIGTGALEVRLRDPADRPEAERLLAATLGADLHPAVDPSSFTARVDEPDGVAAALAALSDAGIRVVGYTLGQPSLDEVFLSLTDRAASGRGSRQPRRTAQEAS